MYDVSRHEAESGHAGIFYACMVALLAFLVLLSFFVPAQLSGGLNPFFSEDGLIEVLSASGYVAVVLLMLVLGGPGIVRGPAAGIMALMFVMAGRELDFHTRFTSKNMTKLSYYFSGEVPLVEKLLVVLVVLALAWIAWTLIVGCGRPFVERLKRLDPAAVAVSLAIFLAGLSKTIDGAAGKLAALGLSVAPASEYRLVATEETLELGIPVACAIAVVAYFDSLRSKGEHG